jgi:hypothetical protein
MGERLQLNPAKISSFGHPPQRYHHGANLSSNGTFRRPLESGGSGSSRRAGTSVNRHIRRHTSPQAPLWTCGQCLEKRRRVARYETRGEGGDIDSRRGDNEVLEVEELWGSSASAGPKLRRVPTGRNSRPSSSARSTPSVNRNVDPKAFPFRCVRRGCAGSACCPRGRGDAGAEESAVAGGDAPVPGRLAGWAAEVPAVDARPPAAPAMVSPAPPGTSRGGLGERMLATQSEGL